MIVGRKDIPLGNFNIIIEAPENRLSSACVNIYDDGKFNMNGKLSSILGGKALQIRLTDNCRNMCFLEPEDKSGSTKFPRSGSRRFTQIAYLLKAHGLVLPAKYEFWYSESTKCWQGEYVENPMKKPLVKPQGSKKN